jgi:YidC/Oxa1 family membrane protein insertase
MIRILVISLFLLAAVNPANASFFENGAQNVGVDTGPAGIDTVSSAAVGSEEYVYGHLPVWFAKLCEAIAFVLDAFYSVLGSWGLAILVLAVLLRVLLHPLSRYAMVKQSELSAKQEKIKPIMTELKKKYKNDSAQYDVEVLELYKRNGISPLDPLKTLLPLLIQIPLLLTLYQILTNKPELSGIAFLWMDDLTKPDSLLDLGFDMPWLGGSINLLPIIMFMAHIAIVFNSHAQKDAANRPNRPAKSHFVFPTIMFLLFYPFPSGCMLYWTSSSILQYFEQRWTKGSVKA